jgi:hypothetical protein
VRLRSKMSLRRTVSRGVPEIAVRDLESVADVWNPFNSLTVEEVMDDRPAQPQGPMLACPKLPPLRPLPSELAVAKVPR